MNKLFAPVALLLALGLADAQAQVPISQLPSGGLMQQTDSVPVVRGGTTMKAQPYLWPPSGGVMLSTGTSAPTSVLPVNDFCLLGVAGAWQAAPCLPNGTLTATGSPAFGNLTTWAGPNSLTNGNLTGDVTTAGGMATTLATVNSNVGTFQGITVTGKGLVTAAVNQNYGRTSTTNSWLSPQTFVNDGVKLLGSSTGVTTFESSNFGSSNFLLTLPAVNDTVTTNGATQTLTNKTLSAGTITGGTINSATIGAGTPSTGAFTTLSASGTVSGTGFSTYLASPPAIGGTSPAAGTFTSLKGSALIPTGAADGTLPSIYSSGGNSVGITYQGGLIANFFGSASAVNYFQVESATTGSALSFFAAGSDANIGINFSSQGTQPLSFFVNNTQELQVGNGIVTIGGHAASSLGSTSAPTCGTGCSSIVAGSTDTRGALNTGAGVTSITLNFGTTWGAAPFCVLSANTTSGTLTLSSISTTQLVITDSTSITAKIYWMCLQ